MGQVLGLVDEPVPIRENHEKWVGLADFSVGFQDFLRQEGDALILDGDEQAISEALRPIAPEAGMFNRATSGFLSTCLEFFGATGLWKFVGVQPP